MNQIIGIVISIAAVFAVLSVVALLKKRGLGDEAARKLAHILLSNWIILSIAVFRDVWAVCVAPACFVALNYISHRRGLFSAIERRENNTAGTVWYAVSLLLLCLWGWSLETPWLAACGMLSMGYGDGIAALVGRRAGRRGFPAPYGGKSLEGTVTVAALSGVAVGAVCLVYSPSIALTAALCCGAVAAAVELFSPGGVDNLTLPLSVSLTVFLLAGFPALRPGLTGLAVSIAILIPAFYLRAINPPGFFCAALLGALLRAWGGAISFGALLAFFTLGSIVSRIGKAKKSSATALHQRRGARSAVQVVSNGLPPLLFSALYRFTGQEVCLLAVLASFAAAAADTFSSEIGMLSRKDPVSILTLRPIQRGISGGVTLLGFAAAAVGALPFALLSAASFGMGGGITVFVLGVAGSLLDSLMGALLQAKYHLPTGGLTERPLLDGVPLRLARGIGWINNDMINFASIMLCGAFCAFTVL